MTMKKTMFKLMLLAPIVTCFGQIDPNLLLGLTTATTTEISGITGSLEGSILYNKDEKRIYLYNATLWQKIPDITDLLPATYTPGSILYTNLTGEPEENNSQLFWNSTLNRLGIGTNAPTHKLQVAGQLRANSLVSEDGTASAPSYRFNDDSDTGMYRSGTNELSFVVGSKNVLTLAANENIGIATLTSPTSKLEIGGSFATAIDVTTGDLTLDETHHTIILGGSHNITLPAANSCKGRIYVIKNPYTLVIAASISTYKSLVGLDVSLILNLKTIWLQSDGVNWQQIQ